MKIEMNEIDENYTKITATITDPILSLDDMNFIENNMHELASQFTKAIVKDKDLAASQYLIKEQMKEVKELKRKLRLHKKTISKLLKEIKEMKGRLQ